MKTQSYNFVDKFDTDTMRYDYYGEFYNAYQRKHKVDPGAKRPKLSGNGEMRANEGSGYYSGTYPILHFATGEMFLLNGITEHEHRGRYTFGGYDFSVISTGSNDSYGQIAIQHMHFLSTHEQLIPSLPKINQAAFNTRPNHDTQIQSLLIDHMTDRVIALGGMRQNGDEKTIEGTNPGGAKQAVPERFRYVHQRAYATAPGVFIQPQRAILFTTPRSNGNLPEGYADIVDQCMMWDRMHHRDINAMEREYMDQVSVGERYHVASSYALPPELVVKQGFMNLHPYDRARVARNNTDKKKLHRLEYKLHCLGFNSAAFFEAIAAYKS